MKGIGVDRSTNDDKQDYVKVTNLEQQGLRQYIHKFDLGMQEYYYNVRFRSQLEKLVNEDWRAQNPIKC